MLRFVCTNSMIAGERFEEVRVPHKGNIQDDIIEGVYTVPETPMHLDALLADEPLAGGLEPRLGSAFLCTLTIVGFPSRSAERRGGKVCVHKGSSRVLTYH